MYSPDFYRENRNQLIYDLIREYPFALLLSRASEQVSHLPLILDHSDEARPYLLGHMAKANPHWRELSEKSECKIIFQGPHGYISPAWYQPKADNVPTWNYTVAHVQGSFQLLEGAEAFLAMDRIVNEFEGKYKTGWELPKSERAIAELMKAIAVFRIESLQFEAKFKLSQKQNMTDRENVIAQLQKTGNQELRSLADKMKSTTLKP